MAHILLEYPLHQDERPLHQDERDGMRGALSVQGIALRRHQLLTKPEARTIMAEFMAKTGLLVQSQAVDSAALGKEGVGNLAKERR